jgi:hypothetical protein
MVYHGSSARLPREPNHTLVLYTIRVHSLLGSSPWLGIDRHASLMVFVWIRVQCPDLRVDITTQQSRVASGDLNVLACHIHKLHDSPRRILPTCVGSALAPNPPRRVESVVVVSWQHARVGLTSWVHVPAVVAILVFWSYLSSLLLFLRVKQTSSASPQTLTDPTLLNQHRDPSSACYCHIQP